MLDVFTCLSHVNIGHTVPDVILCVLGIHYDGSILHTLANLMVRVRFLEFLRELGELA